MPNAATIETLEIEIKQRATGAITHLKSIAKALREVKSATADNGLASIATGINKINRACENFKGMERLEQLRDVFRDIRTEAEGAAKAIGAMNDAIKTSPTSRMYRNLQGTLTRAQTAATDNAASRAASAVTESGGAAQKMPDSFQETAAETKNVAAATEQLTERIERLRTANHNLRDDLAASRAANKELRLALRGIKSGAEEAETGLQKLMKMLKRLIIYRMLRALITGFVKALKEGLENMYKWSKLNNGEFAKSMDRLASCAAQLKNALAVMIAPLIQMVVPIIEILTKVIVGLANAISMLVSFLMGAATWTKVNTDYMTEWKESAGAAQRTILAFDEINKLNGKNGGGGGGVGDMFSEIPLSVTMSYEKYKELMDKLMASIGLVSDAYDDATDSSDKFGDAQLDLVAVLAKVMEALTKTKTTAERLREAQGDYLKEMNAQYELNAQAVRDWANRVAEAFNSVKVRITTWVTNTVTAIKNWGTQVKEAFNTVKNNITIWVTDTATAIGNWAIDVKNKAVEAATNLVTSIRDGLTNAKTAVVTWVKDTVASVVNWGIEMKDKAVAAVTNVATSIANGFAAAKNTIVTWVTNTLTSMSNWATNVATNVWNGICGVATNIYDALSNAYTNISNWAVSASQAFADWINNTVTNIGDWASNFASKIGAALVNGWTNFKNFMSAIGQKITSSFALIPLGAAMAGAAAAGLSGAGGGDGGGGLKPFSPAPALYDKGGFPTIGDLFIANERGPELVGTMNNRPAVANSQQIIEGVASGVAKAMAEQERLLREQNDILRKKGDAQVVLSTGTLVSAFDRMNRRNGNTVVPIGG